MISATGTPNAFSDASTICRADSLPPGRAPEERGGRAHPCSPRGVSPRRGIDGGEVDPPSGRGRRARDGLAARRRRRGAGRSVLRDAERARVRRRSGLVALLVAGDEDAQDARSPAFLLAHGRIRPLDPRGAGERARTVRGSLNRSTASIGDALRGLPGQRFRASLLVVLVRGRRAFASPAAIRWRQRSRGDDHPECWGGPAGPQERVVDMRRSSCDSWRPWIAFLPGALALALAAAACGGVGTSSGAGSTASGGGTAGAPRNPDAVQLLFTYGSEKEEWIKEATARFNVGGWKTAAGKPIYVEAGAQGQGGSVREG